MIKSEFCTPNCDVYNDCVMKIQFFLLPVLSPSIVNAILSAYFWGSTAVAHKIQVSAASP